MSDTATVAVNEGCSRIQAIHVIIHSPDVSLLLIGLFRRILRTLKMDGLSSLEALEDLWLCRNRLTEIGDGLPLGRTLREVNLAHNRLGCFKELLKLAPLEGLRSLTLQDIHFGDNPVCGLSNYKTYVAYHLTQVLSRVLTLLCDSVLEFVGLGNLGWNGEESSIVKSKFWYSQ